MSDNKKALHEWEDENCISYQVRPNYHGELDIYRRIGPRDEWTKYFDDVLTHPKVCAEIARLAERNKKLQAVVELAPKCICSENEDGVAVVNFGNTHTHRCKVYRKALMKAGCLDD